MDVKKLTDAEIDNQILNLNTKINLSNNTDIINQLVVYLDALYDEQEERSYIENFDSTEGVLLDVEESVQASTKSDKKDKNKNKEKPKSFLERIPKIEPKWNVNHPKNQKEE